MKKPYHFLVLLPCLYYMSRDVSAQGSTKNVYFTNDSSRLSDENVDLLSKSYTAINPGERVTYRILIHEDSKNKGLLNELDRKRSLEILDFFNAEGIPATSIKLTKTPGREAKGFVSDDMKNLLVYDIEVYKSLPAVQYTNAGDLDLSSDGPELFTITGASEKIITGAQGVQITVQAGTFEYKTGILASGEVKIELREAVKLNQLLSGGVMTMSDELPLQVTGAIWLKASIGDKELRVRKGKRLSIRFPPTVALAEPKLFTGTDVNGVINLHPVETPLAAQTTPEGYWVSSTTVHWIACAMSEKSSPKGSLTVKASASYPLAVRLIIPEEHLVLAAYPLPDSKDLAFTHLTAGKKAILLVYGAKDGKTYFSSKEITTSVDGKEKISPKEETTAALKELLKGLDK